MSTKTAIGSLMKENTIKVCGVRSNPTYEYVRRKERERLIQLLSKNYKVHYYNNFIVVNGETFNGYNEEIINKIMEEIK